MDREQKILKERSEFIAGEKASSFAGYTEGLSVIEFSLLPERYAVAISHVSEVFPLKELTPIPGTPAFIMGVVNLRGKIITIINLKTFLGLHEKGLTELNKVILLKSDPVEFGVVVDSIEGNKWILEETLCNPPIHLSGPGAELIRGITPEGTIFLHAEKLLQCQEFIVNQKLK